MLLKITLCLSSLLLAVDADLSRFENNFKFEDKDSVGFSSGSLKMIADGEEKKTFHPEGVDFTGCSVDPGSDMCCMMKQEERLVLEKQPVMECTHKVVEKCHYSYVTKFHPSKEEICDESFDKKCSISFTQTAQNETVRKCYTPLVKVCGKDEPMGNDISDQEQGVKSNIECKTYYESSCTERYVEKSPGKFVKESKCEKLPVELCGQGNFFF